MSVNALFVTDFKVEDSSITDAGMVGLWTKADCVALFDDLTYGEVR